MNKKSLLLMLTTTPCVAVVATMLFVSNNLGINSFALNRGVPASEYSITMSATNCTKVTSNLLRSSTDSGSWSFNFYKTGDARVSFGSFPFYGGGEAFLSFGDNDSYSYLNNASGHGISGITSITVDYCRQTNYVDNPTDTSSGEVGDLKILFGYVDSQGSLLYETTSHDLSPDTPYDMSDLEPRYFKITGSKDFKTEYTNGRINIKSIKICYSCDSLRTDAAVREDLFSNQFEVEPIKVGNDWTYGYYPQTLSDISEVYEALYQENPESFLPLDNGYYLLDGDFFKRVQAQGTGYNNEYVKDEYYWFKVEPVSWRFIDWKYDTATLKKLCYVVTSEKILDTSIFDAYGNEPTSYSASTVLRQFVNNLYTKMFPSNRDSRLYGSDLSGGPENNMYEKLFPLTRSTLSNENFNFHYDEDRVTYATDYARSRAYDFPSTGYVEDNGNISMYYWTRTFSGGSPYHVRANGGLYTTGASYYSSLGVRPACRIIKN